DAAGGPGGAEPGGRGLVAPAGDGERGAAGEGGRGGGLRARALPGPDLALLQVVRAGGAVAPDGEPAERDDERVRYGPPPLVRDADGSRRAGDRCHRLHRLPGDESEAL